MLATEREKLLSYECECLNIGITVNGTPLSAIEILWTTHSSALRMRTPDIYLCEEDLYDYDILRQLDRFAVLGFYAFCPLSNYDVIGRFSHLEDIFLTAAYKLQDLSFMEHTPDWSLLFIQEAHLPNLDPLLLCADRSRVWHNHCIGLYHCQVDDISSLLNSPLRIYELLIWQARDKTERARWKKVNALVHHYFPTDVPKE